MLCQRSLGVRGSRLCMELLLGSSRMTRFTMMVSSREENQPCEPRSQPEVEVGLDGMRAKARRPTTRVMRPFEKLEQGWSTGEMNLLR